MAEQQLQTGFLFDQTAPRHTFLNVANLTVAGGSTGDVLTKQVDGTAKYEAPSGGGGAAYTQAFYTEDTLSAITGFTPDNSPADDLNFDDNVAFTGEPTNFTEVGGAGRITAVDSGPIPAGNLQQRRTTAMFGPAVNDSIVVRVRNEGRLAVNISSAGGVDFSVKWPGGSLSNGSGTITTTVFGNMHGVILGTSNNDPVPLLLSSANKDLLIFRGTVPTGSSAIGNSTVDFSFEADVTVALQAGST